MDGQMMMTYRQACSIFDHIIVYQQSLATLSFLDNRKTNVRFYGPLADRMVWIIFTVVSDILEKLLL